MRLKTLLLEAVTAVTAVAVSAVAVSAVAVQNKQAKAKAKPLDMKLVAACIG